VWCKQSQGKLEKGAKRNAITAVDDVSEGAVGGGREMGCGPSDMRFVG